MIGDMVEGFQLRLKLQFNPTIEIDVRLFGSKKPCSVTNY